MRERMYRLMSDLGGKAGKEILGFCGGGLGCGVDLGVALNASMARDSHEVDATDNFLES